jgi:hypothetical protein
MCAQHVSFQPRSGACYAIWLLLFADLCLVAIVCCAGQIMSLLVRPNKESKVLVNFEMKEKNYSDGLNFCRNDGYVHFRSVLPICHHHTYSNESPRRL